MFAYTLDEMLELRRAMAMQPSERPYWFNPATGICGNLFYLHEFISTDWVLVSRQDHHTALVGYFKTWKHFSGNQHYPIPSCTDSVPSAEYHHRYSCYRDQYDRTDAYCKLRYDLVDHIIEQMTAELNR